MTNAEAKRCACRAVAAHIRVAIDCGEGSEMVQATTYDMTSADYDRFLLALEELAAELHRRGGPEVP